MLVIIVISWVQSIIEGMFNIKQLDQENVFVQMCDIWEVFKNFFVEQKNEVVVMVCWVLVDLDEEIDEVQMEIDQGWQNFFQEVCLEKQEMLSELKDECEELQVEYQEL